MTQLVLLEKHQAFIVGTELMARIKPQALLQQSKKKKGPARISVTTILLSSLIGVLTPFFLYATYRHWSHRFVAIRVLALSYLKLILGMGFSVSLFLILYYLLGLLVRVFYCMALEMMLLVENKLWLILFF